MKFCDVKVGDILFVPVKPMFAIEYMSSSTITVKQVMKTKIKSKFKEIHKCDWDNNICLHDDFENVKMLKKQIYRANISHVKAQLVPRIKSSKWLDYYRVALDEIALTFSVENATEEN